MISNGAARLADVVDLFAGPGGWSLGLRTLGFDALGIEVDEFACGTRAHADLHTQRADLTRVDPYEYTGVVGLVASPPCTDWSLSGKQEGWAGETGPLVELPMKWVAAIRPEWLAFEQVPTVLTLWRSYAEQLRAYGYNTWTGYLQAEQFGVPQTRKRAFLLASMEPFSPPQPTHSRYYVRNPQRCDPGVRPWISMADALERDDLPAWCSETPAPTVAGDPRLAPRGCKHPRSGCCSKWAGVPGLQFGPGTVRVTPREAGILQSFPTNYPWQGTQTQRFTQIGNAVPPRLAEHVLSAVSGVPMSANQPRRMP